ncbi:hypothetical protein [Salinilacihabitans rarus]|uniref:hypothetical protein n=1 Tax=Salinilacihabitans rarus TaxID=2961596 RepID=UPI0020C87461|nr:hypothetical protein [Salinilacihabitans rarus]
MTGDDRVTRRALLGASGGALAAPFALAGDVRADDEEDERPHRRCPEATLRPSMTSCPGSNADGCADDDPETERLRGAVERTIERRYPTVGALLDAGFVPYFDTLVSGESGGYSHWLHPEFVGDDTVLDPGRPEAVLVDDERWRPIGAMFVATRSGERVERPPDVYRGEAEDGGRCSPWHAHAGLPGRFAWWYYRQVYEDAASEGEVLPDCRTPCMLHVWTVSHPEGTYAHDVPPPEYRGGPDAEPAGFETAADPGTDVLGWDALPDDAVPDETPAELFAEWAR